MPLAITRAVSASLARCELTHLAREPIDVPLARRQHRAYEDALRAAGCELIALPPLDALPDAVFVEDTVVVAGRELAVITRPGAPPRRDETASIAAVLAGRRTLRTIEAPGTMDGGDVLRLGHRLFVGRSSRTNDAAIAQLAAHVGSSGGTVQALDVEGCLHLKSAVTQVAAATVLLNPRWVAPAPFAPFTIVEVDPSEPFAANGLLVGGVVLFPASFPRTRARLQNRGITVVPLDVSELQKAEGAVTCCSVVLE